MNAAGNEPVDPLLAAEIQRAGDEFADRQTERLLERNRAPFEALADRISVLRATYGVEGIRERVNADPECRRLAAAMHIEGQRRVAFLIDLAAHGGSTPVDRLESALRQLDQDAEPPTGDAT